MACKQHVTLYPLIRSCTHYWMPPRSLFACILPGCLLAMRNNDENKREICILLKQLKKPQRKIYVSDLPISSMEPTTCMSNVFTEEWKIFFFVVLFSLGNIVGLFLRLIKTKSCTELNASDTIFVSLHWNFILNLTSDSLWIQCFKITFSETQ